VTQRLRLIFDQATLRNMATGQSRAFLFRPGLTISVESDDWFARDPYVENGDYDDYDVVSNNTPLEELVIRRP
jgi:hypothetical protein